MNIIVEHIARNKTKHIPVLLLVRKASPIVIGICAIANPRAHVMLKADLKILKLSAKGEPMHGVDTIRAI